MRRILVIDDEKGIRVLLRKILEEIGYEVVEASDGEEGVGIYRDQQADVVITNIVMPRKDGCEVIRELTGDVPDVRIIAISGDPACLPVAQALGASRAFSKPSSIRDLLGSVEELVDRGLILR